MEIKKVGVCGGGGCRGQYALSHGKNFSAGVAILFSSALNITTYMIVNGKLILMKVQIEDFIFHCINIYDPIQGLERQGVYFLNVFIFLQIGKGFLKCWMVN